jgi:hypothetical protein
MLHRFTHMSEEGQLEIKKTAARNEEETQWFVLKVSRKERLATEVLKGAGLKTFCPTVPTDITMKGEKHIVERPLIPNTIFVSEKKTIFIIKKTILFSICIV